MILVLVVAALLAASGCASGTPIVPTAPATGEMAERLRRDVVALTTQFGPRDFANPAGLDAAAAYIEGQMRQHSQDVGRQSFTVGGERFTNVTAQFGPESDERIVIGAHYDTAGPLPGADDNASGVAGLLELVRCLATAAPPVRIELVAYSLEEPPNFRSANMGSAQHARAARQAGHKIRFMLSLEMLGYFRDEPESQQFPNRALEILYPTTGNFIAVVGRLSDYFLVRSIAAAVRKPGLIPVESLAAPQSLGHIELSDHLSYWNEGYPAVMITDTSFFRNPNYHTARDTHDTLDYERMARVVTSVHRALLDMAHEE